MKRINFRHPRYAIPLIILPFLVLLNYLWLDMTPAATAAQAKVEIMGLAMLTIPIISTWIVHTTGVGNAIGTMAGGAAKAAGGILK